MRNLNLLTLVFAVVILALSPQLAEATTLATTTHALNDGFGPSGGVWQGSQSYSGSLLFDTLDADVEFAVFAPGNFQSFLNENGIVFADPASSEYIYAYQVVAIGGSSSPVTNISVGLQGDEALGSSGVTFIPAATDYGTYSPTPVQDPGSAGGGPGVSTSSVWASIGGFPTGQATGILFYSSPHGPELGYSTVAAGIASQQIANSLPNPIPVPEPAAALLCVCSVLCLATPRLRR